MDPSSFHPPSLPDHDATVARDWVLLDTRAYMSDRRNGTTATAFASNGLIVEASFWFAAPPALSHFTIHCRGVDEQNGLAMEPRLVCSDEYVAILSIDFTYYRGQQRERVPRNYFVYTAITDSPSLVRLPNPFPINFDPRTMGLLRTADRKGFVVAVLSPQLLPGSYDLLIFSSKQWGWIAKSVQLQAESQREDHQTFKINKVIALPEEGSLGWVDLWQGILVCNVLDQEPSPALRFIPLSCPMAANMNMVDENENHAWLHRDVAYVDGLIRFVEIETRRSITTRGPDAIRGMRVYADLELDDTNTSVCNGWMAVAWVRKPSSDAWVKECEADVDDINLDNPRYSSLPELRGSCAGKPTLKNLMTANPTLGMHGSDVVVYLISKVMIHHENAWIIAINMTRKTLEHMALFSAKRTLGFGITCRPCAFFRHLGMTADHRGARLRTKASENPITNYTTVLVSGLDPCLTMDELRQILAQFGELHDMQVLEDQRSVVVKFVDRLCAENAICELNLTPLGSRYLLHLKREHVDCPNGPRKAEQDVEGPHPYPEYYVAYSCDAAMVDADRNRKRSSDTSVEHVARGGSAQLALFGEGVLALPLPRMPPRHLQDPKRTKR